MTRYFYAVILALCLSASASEEVKLTSKPSVVKSGDKTMISFAVSAPTDVEVSIQDSTGKVVRHLVAGVLGGKNPPPEPFKPGLSQNIEWDGKDDFGKTASGSFKVHIGAGMKTQFDGFLMFNPDGGAQFNAIAAGPNGQLYAFIQDSTANGNMGGDKIKIFNREGHHVHTVTPFRADIAPEKVKAIGAFQTAEGDLIPHVYNAETLGCYPDTMTYRGRDMPPYTSPAVDAKGRLYWMVKGPKICCVDSDGGCPYESFTGPQLLSDVKNLCMASEYLYNWDRCCLAVSGDGKYLYFTGLKTGELGKEKDSKPLTCVYRVPADTRGPAEVFVGKPGQSGTEKDLLTEPHGMAVANGVLYVADRTAGRIVMFKEADKSFAGEIKLAQPDTVAVDPHAGIVYACCATGNGKMTADLVKLKDGKEICRMALPAAGGSPWQLEHRIALDCSSNPPIIWLPSLSYNALRLIRIEDLGTKFGPAIDPRSKELCAEGPRDLSVDRVRDELYVKANSQNYYRFDDVTGKLKDTIDLAKVPNNCNSTQLVPGTDGNLYTDTWGTGLWRFDHKGTELKWEGQASHIIPLGGIMCFQERHLALKPFAPVDEFYLIPPATAQPLYTALNIYGQDGKARRTVVWGCLQGGTPKLDAKGNIYLADLIKPPDHSYPEFFDGKLEAPPKECGGGDKFWYSYMYASIIKFPPGGGVIWSGKDMPASAIGQPPSELLAKPKVPFKRHYGYQPHLTGELQGALWYHFGFAPYSAHMSGMTSHCMCEGSGFDVDPYGRVYLPNLGQFRVEVIDTNNNPITTFGKYGNDDSGGKDAQIKKPEIPLAWPNYVAVSDTHAYVSDSVNRRVVRVKLTYAAEATCPVQ